ncbi:hypothetical protein KY342_03595 [Candidatus Woesearchaeota archaeon]|nr:hypothetical protein [Candidatus Woesearchaeota archaeon]
MKDKKGMSSQMMGVVIGFIIAAAILAISFYFIRGGARTGQQVLELSPKIDALCIAATKTKSLTYEIKDMDNDNRDDQTCDWCVCQTGCDNDDDDKDGDKLPDKCDAAPDDIKVVKFNEQNCAESNLVNLAGDKKQCRPS